MFQECIKVVRQHGAFRDSTFACHCASRQLNLLVDRFALCVLTVQLGVILGKTGLVLAEVVQ